MISKIWSIQGLRGMSGFEGFEEYYCGCEVAEKKQDWLQLGRH